jgi:hypothetical protein
MLVDLHNVIPKTELQRIWKCSWDYNTYNQAIVQKELNY